jgi:hypothetical protein
LPSRIASDPETARAAPRDQATLKRLFTIATAALPEESASRTGITIYDALGTPMAWAGRVSDLGKDVVLGPTSVIVLPGPLGPGLVRVERSSPAARAPPASSSNRRSARHGGGPGLAETFAIPTSIVPVTIRVRAGGAAARPQPFSFIVPGGDRGFVLEADVSPADLAAARARWRAVTRAAVLGVLTITLLLCTGPLFDLRRRIRNLSRFLGATALLIVLVVTARAVMFVALAPLRRIRIPPGRSVADDADARERRVAAARSDRATAVRAAAGPCDGPIRRGVRRRRRGVLRGRPGHGVCCGATNGCSSVSSPTRTSISSIFRCTRSAADAWPSSSRWCCSMRPSSGALPLSYVCPRRCCGRRAPGCGGDRSRQLVRRGDCLPSVRLLSPATAAGRSDLDRAADIRRLCARAGALSTAGCGASHRRPGSPCSSFALVMPAVAMYPSVLAHATTPRSA